MNLKIGILLPRSDMYPTLALDFLNGLKLIFSASTDQNWTPTFLVEGIGNGADVAVLKTAEKLILQENVAITLAFCGNNQLTEFISIFNNYKKPLIHIDLGGSVLKKDEFSPYVLHHTLNIWQSAYAAGTYAANNIGKKAAVISSMYDGGYHMAAAFGEGYTVTGGEVDHFYVAPMDYKSESYETMMAGLKDASPDVIFAIFSYKEGQKVFDIIAKSSLNKATPILAIPLMTDEYSNPRNLHIENVMSIATWSFDDEQEIMQNFIHSYKEAYEDAPNIIGLLGFEVGVTLSNCISSEGKISSKIADTVQNKTFSTPRGQLNYNQRNESQINYFKIRKFQFNKTNYHNAIVDTLDASFSEELYETFENLPSPGWQNPYICT